MDFDPKWKIVVAVAGILFTLMLVFGIWGIFSVDMQKSVGEFLARFF